MIVVVRGSIPDVDVAEAHFVPLDRLHDGSRTCHKLTCADCGHQFNPERVVATADGFICRGCLDES